MTLDEFMHLNWSKGYHWFDPKTMEAFDSEIETWDKFTGIFISSEKAPFPGSKRLYTVRFANFITGNVEKISKFQEFKTIEAAKDSIVKERNHA